MSRRLLVALALLMGCDQAPPKSGPAAPAPPPADESALKGTLDRWYVAIHDYDSTGIASALTSSFLILEDTLPMDKVTLVREILAAKGHGSQTAALTDFKTRFQGDVAWTTFHNHEVFTSETGKAAPKDFLETVVFVREGNRWLIDRYHAAALPEPARPK